MRTDTAKKKLWLGVSVAAVAACVVTGASALTGSGTITTFAGTGKIVSSGAPWGNGGPATSARIFPIGVAVDRQGNVYISGNSRVYKVSPGGTITALAGTGRVGNSGDGGPATSAELSDSNWVAADGKGNVYITDTSKNRVRRVGPGGTITTFAGTGAFGFSGDGGPANAAQLDEPHGVAVDGKGNLYIVDHGNHRVRKVSPAGTITTIAGTGKAGNSGDGGPATSAQLYFPEGVAVDGKGNVYIADTANFRVRKVSPAGKITTFAGNGQLASSSGNNGNGGPATSARLSFPTGVAVDGKGNVYITDPNDHRVRKVSPAGTIMAFAGTGKTGFSGDRGRATSARLTFPEGVAVDGKGNVYIADRGNYRVRKVRG